MKYEAQLKRQYQNAIAVSCAFILSVVCYGVVASLVETGDDRLLETGKNGIMWLRLFLFGLGAAAVFSISRIRSMLLSAEINFSNAESPAASLSRRLFLSTVITMAAAEIPACMGLILFFISSDLKDYYVFAALAMSAMIIYLPKYDRWDTWLRQKLKGYADYGIR